MRRPNSGLVLILLGASLLAGARLGQAQAAAEPGSGLGSYNLAASAPGVQLREDDPNLCYKSAAGPNGCEGAVPYALATLRNGPIGHGLAAVAWPGVIAAGAGSLLITVGSGNVPPGATALNDPVRADAYTNVGNPTVSNNSIPGSTMTATAHPDQVTAQATVASTEALPTATFGSTLSRSSTVLSGASLAVATAHSEVKDVNVAGVVHIGSLVSDARATTDGTKATATGKTIASNVTVAGIPVSVDDRGITAMGATTPTGTAQTAANTAINQAGISMALGAPTGNPQGPSASFNAQSLVIVFKNPTGFTSTVVLGGANASVASTPALAFSPLPPAQSAGAVPPPTATTGSGAAASPVTGLLAPPQLQVNGPAPLTAAVPPAGTPPLLAEADFAEPGGLRTRLMLLSLGGVGLMFAGLRRLPDRLLRKASPQCPNQEAS